MFKKIKILYHIARAEGACYSCEEEYHLNKAISIAEKALARGKGGSSYFENIIQEAELALTIDG